MAYLSKTPNAINLHAYPLLLQDRLQDFTIHHSQLSDNRIKNNFWQNIPEEQTRFPYIFLFIHLFPFNLKQVSNAAV